MLQKNNKERIQFNFFSSLMQPFISTKERGLTSDINGLQGKGLLLIVNQSGLFCLVSHGRQGLWWT